MSAGLPTRSLGERTSASDQILEALGTAGPNGMSRTDISHLFKRHKSAERIGQALSLLLKTGRAKRMQDTGTGGRPSEMVRDVSEERNKRTKRNIAAYPDDCFATFACFATQHRRKGATP